MVRERTFREDLFYRLSVVPIDIPPLRERPEDVVPLTHRFLQEINERYGFARRFSGAVMDRLLRYAWPGNVRELRNIIERLAVTACEDEIGLETLPSDLFVEDMRDAPSNQPLKAAVRSHEVETVRAAVERFGSIGRAAAHLGVSESTVKRRLREGHSPLSH
jgi:transcriptional regulator with PAS, ATPase and Fis domain